MRIEQAHSHSPEEAKARIKALGEYFQNKHGIGITWDGEKVRVNGKYMVVTVEGTMSFEPGKVIFDGKDPGFLWRGKAKDYIEGKLRTYLDPKTKVDDLPRR